MMSLWDALRMNMMISYQELVRTFPSYFRSWHSADISALPHPGIFELSFDIPYQMLLIPF
ncbi:Uncharacterised protein [Klebsiella pneumoniae]|uniref:hypothetical protein n=1 Tax=Klebsiella grimontii TaxID=2058152 RepID=UPI000E2B4DE1|nr:hypothetical protein [Klebsiella grimontii]SVX77860.1 Uncharacterised protein [Klebsiella pneumoniae]SWD86391.1 Uncharacterised protein [Klebsiella pneumoniae]